MAVSIKAITSSEPLIKIHSKVAEKAQIKHQNRIKISYGIRQTEALLTVTDKIKVDIIEISRTIVSHLTIDTSFRYDYNFHQGKFIIGPVIGLLFNQKGEHLQKVLDRYRSYFKVSSEIGGLVYLFALDQINFTKEEINGYTYNFKTSTWKKSVLPFPAVIYRKTPISRRLAEKMKGKIFNPFKFDKFQFWEMLKDNPRLKAHLPETTAEISKKNLDLLLQKYGEVFLKPTKKSQGKGICLINKKENKYMIRRNFSTDKTYLSDKEMEKYLGLRTNNHIFQQAIQLKTYDNRKVDYRVIVVKDLNNQWQCPGVIGWAGEVNGITIHSRIEFIGKKVDEMLKTQFNYHSDQIRKKKDEFSELGKAFALVLDDKAGPYIDFGFDMGLDNDGKLWVFEANVCQNLKAPLWINKYDMFKEVVLSIMNYLKRTAMM